MDSDIESGLSPSVSGPSFPEFLADATGSTDRRCVDAARYVLSRWPNGFDPLTVGRVLRFERSLYSAAYDRLTDEYVATFSQQDRDALSVRGSLTPLSSALGSECAALDDSGVRCSELSYSGTPYCSRHQQFTASDADQLRIGLAVSMVAAAMEAVSTLVDVMRTTVDKPAIRTNAAVAILKASGVDGSTVMTALTPASDEVRSDESPIALIEQRLAALRGG